MQQNPFQKSYLVTIGEINIYKYTKHRRNISCKKSIQQLLKKKKKKKKKQKTINTKVITTFLALILTRNNFIFNYICYL